MAKWGEGDPRWIVEERADAVNVNNWHWTERDATSWSKERLTTLLKDIKVESEEGVCEVTDVSKCEGEASASSRKAKLIYFYEWDIKLDWSGSLLDGKKTYKGEVRVPLSEENEPSIRDVETSVKSGTDEARKVKEIMRQCGAPVIEKLLKQYVTELKEEFSHGMILPTKELENAKISSDRGKKSPTSTPPCSANSHQTSLGVRPGVRICTKKLTDNTEFKCEARELYRALTDREMVQAFTRGSVVWEAEPGGQFAILDGNVTGQFTELESNKKISQRWRFKGWPAEHYSDVSLEFIEKKDCTECVLTQTGIPDNEYERTKEGWTRYYWEPIKQTFGFGSRLL